MKNVVEKMYIAEESVWVVYYGGKVRYAWPKNGLTSGQVADEMQEKWQAELDNS